MRNMLFYTLNGYAGVPPGHPLHGRDCDSVDIPVHGGMTYAGHLPTGEHCCPKFDGLWFFGFDTSHCHDKVPYMVNIQRTFPGALFSSDRGLAYRDEDYVIRELRELGDALRAYTPGGLQG